MYRIVHGDLKGCKDVAEFIKLIKRPPVDLRDFFDPRKEIFVTRAPGRLDVMGGIADYSGSVVLEMPIAEATLAAAQKTDEKTIKIVSLSVESAQNLIFEMPLSQFEFGGKPIEYEDGRKLFSQNSSDHWVSYIAGVFLVLMRERGIDFQQGIRILISSSIPMGKGVSSSAALEVVAMQAVCAAFDIDIPPLEIALLCQKVENLIVGAPCGVMDQITSNCGVGDCLISLLCQPTEIRGFIKIPDEIEFWGIDSGVRHAVAESDYTSVRIGAFMGYRIIADLAGIETRNVGNGLVETDDHRWNGYLSNVSASEYEQSFSANIPDTILGDDFLTRYQGTTDIVTKIDRTKVYQVIKPTEHAIYEHGRVKAFSDLLQNSKIETKLDNLGRLLYESHASYAACGLTEPGTDRIVELVKKSRDEGLFGARISGGGSGGTIVILGRRGCRSAIEKIVGQYEKETGKKSHVFYGSSPGSAAFGHIRLQKA